MTNMSHVDKLTKERDQLKAEVERLKGNRSNLINELVTIVEKSRAENAALRDVIETVMDLKQADKYRNLSLRNLRKEWDKLCNQEQTESVKKEKAAVRLVFFYHEMLWGVPPPKED